MDVKDINLNEYEVSECLDNGNIVLRKKKSKFPTWEGLGNITGVFIGGRSEFFEASCAVFTSEMVGACSGVERDDREHVFFEKVGEVCDNSEEDS